MSVLCLRLLYLLPVDTEAVCSIDPHTVFIGYSIDDDHDAFEWYMVGLLSIHPWMISIDA